MSSICQNCSVSVSANEQMYQVDEMIVCASCAGVSTPQSDLAAAVQARARAKPKRRKSGGAGVGVGVFVAVMIAIAGGVGYMIYSGKLADTVAEQRETLSGNKAVNSVVDRYNTLVTEGNALATDRKYAQAAQKFRDARAVASAVPDVAKEVDPSKLESIIAHYDNLAAGRTSGETVVRTVQVHAPRPTPESAVAEQPARAPEPQIKFMDKGVVSPSVASSDKQPTPNADGHRESKKDDARTKQTDAYIVPERK